MSRDPSGRPRSVGCVAKQRHRLGPGKLTPIPHELLRPILFLFITAAIDELLVVAVGNLEAIDIIRRQLIGSDEPYEIDAIHEVLSRHRDHSVRRGLQRAQREIHGLPCRQSHHELADRWLRYLPAKVALWKSNGFERRLANPDRKSTRLNSSHRCISYAVFCL